MSASVVPLAVAGADGPVLAHAVSTSDAPLLGSTATPVADPDVDESTDVRPEGPWDVIVWDDPVNLMTYVVWVLRKLFGFPEPKARRLMLQVHNEGRALVASEPREQAEFYVQQLHAHGLQATMQRST